MPAVLQRDFGVAGNFEGARERPRFLNGIHPVFMPTFLENPA
jgi:hypothetical protein